MTNHRRDILDALEMTESGLTEATEFVETRKEFAHELRSVDDYLQVPKMGKIHRNQLLTDGANDFVVTGISDDAITTTMINHGEDGINWMDEQTFTMGEILFNLEAQTTANGTPVWAY